MIKTLLVACGFAIVVVGCAEQPIKPESSLVDFTIPIEARAKLPDDIRSLLEEIENGSLPGANAAKIRSTLEGATEITKGKKTTRFLFATDGHKGDLEGHPVIYVVVQNKFNRGIQCGVVVPCW